jgi:hypothetical protein
MKHRLAALLALLVVALATSASAFAFDCIRVSSSLEGLQSSTTSGNWLLFDLSSQAGVEDTLAELGATATPAQAACVATAYRATGHPLYFAIGIGLAAGENPNAAAGGVLAHNNKNADVLGNGKGIDHLENSPIVGAFFGAAAGCGVAIPA